MLQKKKKMQEVQQELDRKKREYELRMRKARYETTHRRSAPGGEVGAVRGLCSATYAFDDATPAELQPMVRVRVRSSSHNPKSLVIDLISNPKS